MNWLLIAVICIIAWNVVRGYTRGVLRMIYSLAAWIVMLAASTVAAPYVRDHILSQTGIEPVILNGIEKQIAIQGQKATGDFDMANILLQQSGAYDTLSVQLTNAIMTGLSFFIVFFLLGIVAYIVRHIIRKIERVPVISTVNRVAGFAVGFIKGMVIVWLLLALTSLFAASEIGQTMTAYINDSVMLKYLYENNPTPELKKYAEMYTDRVEEVKNITYSHDVGFMLYCSYGNGYRLTGKPEYKDVMLTGANSLATRFDERVGAIRSWDFNKKVWQFPVIIDNMMNLEFFSWASKASGDDRFRKMAISHADKTMNNHFRDDYSCYHVVSYDTITGVPHKKQTHQGAADESAWARGQAWALYGFTMMYRETGKPEYLDQAKHIAAFIMNNPNMPTDKVPYWDFDAPGIPNVPRDASAAAIMASALIELSQLDKSEEAKSYLDFAEQQVRSLTTPEYLAAKGSNCNFALMHSTGHFPGNSEVDVPLSYADYYYVEALMRLKKLTEK